jgi:exosortase B
MSYTEQRISTSVLLGRLVPATAYWPIVLAAIPVLVPIYIKLHEHPWKTDTEGHGPFILVAALWLFYRRLDAARAAERRPAPAIGWAILLVGLFALFVGRTQGLLTVEAGAQLPIACGLILILFGPAVLRTLSFPLFFMIFTFPIPGWVFDAITVPLKSLIADCVVELLYHLGYPVAQNGVIITVGAYELLVKDACSGINSLFSLSAVSLFYIHVAKHTSPARNALLIASILPVSFAANLLRVLLLVTMTYYFGDGVTSGFFHDLSAAVLFTGALLCIFLVDAVLLALSHLKRRIVNWVAA